MHADRCRIKVSRPRPPARRNVPFTFVYARQRPPYIGAALCEAWTEVSEAIASVTTLRRKGHEEAEYPWRLQKHHVVVYTNQDAKLKGNTLFLPNNPGAANDYLMQILAGLRGHTTSNITPTATPRPTSTPPPLVPA